MALRKTSKASSTPAKVVPKEVSRVAVPAAKPVASTPVRNTPVPRAAAPAPAARKEPTRDDIAQRAYGLWQSRGGSESDNWFQAERELRGL